MRPSRERRWGGVLGMPLAQVLSATAGSHRKLVAWALRVLCVAATLHSATLHSAALAASESSHTFYETWQREASPLMGEQEARVYRNLDTDQEREDFIRRFWTLRDPDTSRAGNLLRERFRRNAQLAWDGIGNPEDHRSQVIVLHGPPRYAYEISCGGLLPMHLFYYEQQPERSEGFVVLFHLEQSTGQRYLVWNRSYGYDHLVAKRELLGLPLDALLDRVAKLGCSTGGEHLHGFFTGALQEALGWGALAERSPFPVPTETAERAWLEEFRADRSKLRGTAPVPTGSTQIRVLDRIGDRTVLQGMLLVPKTVWNHESEGYKHLGETTGGLNLLGRFRPIVVPRESRRDPQRLVPINGARFRQQLPLESLQPVAELPIYFYQDLPVGSYELSLRLEDTEGRLLLQSTHEVEITPDAPLADPQPTDANAIHLAPGNLSLLSRQASVEILPLPGLQVGATTIEVTTTGTEVAALRVALDEGAFGPPAEAPFFLTVDLGNEPRPRTIRVVAVDSKGRELARDSLRVNVGSHRFAVRWVEPQAGAQSTDGTPLLARVAVAVPTGAALDRVEFHLGDSPFVTLYQPPFVQPLPGTSDDSVNYLKAVAYLTDGRSTEDLVVINLPGELDEIEVTEVELFASITDRRGRPISDLQEGEVRIHEAGTEQELLSLKGTLDFPVQAGLLIDGSGSMEAKMPATIESALGFLDTVLQPGDQASVLTFDSRPRLVVPLTHDLAWLSDGVRATFPQGGTALWDSLIGALNYLGGLEGRQALVLISDGNDVQSRFSHQDALEFGRRSGIAIYPLLLSTFSEATDSKVKLSRPLARLEKLAEATGGIAYHVAGVRTLDKAFRAIEQDLRSQYLFTYLSSTQGEDFRPVRIEVARKGIRVRSIGGYYP